MNVFNESIYRSHLEHSQKGQTWSKHKYIAIKNGRYIYPEDLQKGGTTAKVNSTQAIGNRQLRSKTPEEKAAYKDYVNRKAAHQGYTAYKNNQAKEAYKQQQRSQQINNQIKSAHSNATSSKMELTPGSELKKRAEQRKAASQINTQIKSAHQGSVGTRTNSVQSPAKSAALQKQIDATAKRKEDAAKAAEEAKKKEEAAANPTTTSTTTTEEKKSGSSKGKGGGKKGSGSKKSSSKKEDTTKKTEQQNQQNQQNQTPESASEEAKALGLSDDDIKLLDSNIDVNATDRDTVIKNLALRVIKGDFGNGTDRKTKLGKYYAEIQKKVNEIMKELKSSKSNTVVHSGIFAFDTLANNNGVIGVKAKANEFLMHVGNKNSGRYRRGSGDRPYQHDGRRSASDMSDDELKKYVARKGLERQYNKMSKGTDKLDRARNITEASSNAINRINNKEQQRVNRRPQRERMNLDGMTDKELRDRINRELLEKQYSDLFGPEVDTVSKGEKKFAQILDTAGDVLAVTTSAILLAQAIKGKM